jgi:hypothetical protein
VLYACRDADRSHIDSDSCGFVYLFIQLLKLGICGIAMADRRAEKRRRVASLIALNNVSDTALCSIVARLKEESVDSLTRREIQSVVNKEYAKVHGSVQLPLTKGGPFHWDICRPDSLLSYFIKESPPFKKAVESVAHRAGPRGTPLHLIFYVDEITPGNILRPENKRKFAAFYFSFKEFGPELLCRAEMWMPLAVLRSSVIHEVRGGLSNCVRILLRAFFIGPCTFASTGVPLALDEPALLFCKFGNLLADEAAIKATWLSKGAAGLKPCLVCKNVMMLGSDLVQGQRYLVEASCDDFARFDVSSDEDIFQAFDNLKRQHGTGTKAYFEKLEKACGFVYHPDAILADEELRKHILPSTSSTYDWMHVFVANGIVNVELALFFSRANSVMGLTFEHVVKFAQATWQWPHVHRRSGHMVRDMFSETRERASKDTLKCGASELLGAYPFLRYFVQIIVEPSRKLIGEVNSLLGLFLVMDLLMAAKHMAPRPGELLSAIERHSRAFQVAYTADALKPKHHFAFHIPGQLERDGLLLDTFVHERKHQVAKHYAALQKNTTSYEKSVIARVLLHQARDLRNLIFGDVLIGKTREYEPLAAAMGGDRCTVADSLQWKATTFAVKDIVFLNSRAMMVEACASVDDSLCLVVRLLHHEESSSPTSSKWRLLPDVVALMLATAGTVSLASCWNWSGDYVLVLM